MGKDGVDILEELLGFLDADEEALSMQVNPYIQNPAARAWLDECLPGTRVLSADGWAPFQAEGVIGEHPFYYRERWGNASLKIALPGEDPIIGFNWSSFTPVEDNRDTNELWVLTFLYLVEEMNSTDEFRYKYNAQIAVPGKPVNNVVVHAWGKTPKEALAEYNARNASEPYQEYLIIDENAINAGLRESPFIVNVPDSARGEDGKIAYE